MAATNPVSAVGKEAMDVEERDPAAPRPSPPVSARSPVTAARSPVGGEGGSSASESSSLSSMDSECASPGEDGAPPEAAAAAETAVDAPEGAGEDEVDLARVVVPSEQLAEEKKAEGNAAYAKKDYSTAVLLYTEAITLCPTCAAYYSNRSAAYMMLYQFDRALEDARRSTQLDPTFVKGYHREGKCHLAMGEVATATLCYERILAIEPNNATFKTEGWFLQHGFNGGSGFSLCQKSMQAKAVQTYIAKAEESFARQDYRAVIFCMDKSIELSPECAKFKILKAECLAMLKRYQESQEIVNDVLRRDPLSADAIYVRGLCLYFQDSVDKAFQHFQQVLRLAPDHAKARDVYRKAKALAQKKEDGNAAFKVGRMQAAYDLYSEALAIDATNVFTNSKLYCNRATVCAKLKKPQAALDDCNKALELDDNYVKAYLRRAKCYMELEQYEEAVRDYEKICKLDKSRENKQLLQDAKLELKKSKRKDYYKLLGLGKDAGEDAIKKAYKKHALLHHPDRHMGASEEDKKTEERKFKEIGEAYGVLSDPKKKARYDSGQDLEEGGAGGFQDIDPNIIFQSFFGGGQGFGGMNFPQQQQQGGFPGGFSFQFG